MKMIYLRQNRNLNKILEEVFIRGYNQKGKECMCKMRDPECYKRELDRVIADARDEITSRVVEFLDKG